MNRKKMVFLGLIIEIIGIVLMFLCIFMNTAVPLFVQILIWVGIAITMIFTLGGKKGVKKTEEEGETQKHIYLPLIVLIILTIVLTLFSIR